MEANYIAGYKDIPWRANADTVKEKYPNVTPFTYEGIDPNVTMYELYTGESTIWFRLYKDQLHDVDIDYRAHDNAFIEERVAYLTSVYGEPDKRHEVKEHDITSWVWSGLGKDIMVMLMLFDDSLSEDYCSLDMIDEVYGPFNYDTEDKETTIDSPTGQGREDSGESTNGDTDTSEEDSPHLSEEEWEAVKENIALVKHGAGYISGYRDIPWHSTVEDVKIRYPRIKPMERSKEKPGETAYCMITYDLSMFFYFRDNGLYQVMVHNNNMDKAMILDYISGMAYTYGECTYEYNRKLGMMSWSWYHLQNDMGLSITYSNGILMERYNCPSISL